MLKCLGMRNLFYVLLIDFCLTRNLSLYMLLLLIYTTCTIYIICILLENKSLKACFDGMCRFVLIQSERYG